MIYLDNAATSIYRPDSVAEAVLQAMSGMGNASRGVHDSAMFAARTVYEARCLVAELFGCPRADQVVFTSNATEALNIAINGIIPEGASVVTTDLEHNSVLRPLYRLEKERGINLTIVPADEKGRISLADMEEAVGPETTAIVCTHASNLTGNMIDLSAISEIAHMNGALLIADVSQTAGAVPIHMEQMGIDVLCSAGHKGLMGPQGTGVLCFQEGVEIRPWNVGGSGVQSYRKEQPEEYPTRLEAGTRNGHGIAGLSAAVKFLLETGIETIEMKEQSLAKRFYEGVRDIEGVTVYGDFEAEQRAAIVCLNIRDYDSGSVSDELFSRYQIATRPGAHCAPRMHQALHTEKQGAVRFSFSYFNTEEEIDSAIEAVREIAE